MFVYFTVFITLQLHTNPSRSAQIVMDDFLQMFNYMGRVLVWVWVRVRISFRISMVLWPGYG